MKLLVIGLIVSNLGALGYIWANDGGACRELVDMQKAELAKQAEAEQQMQDFLTNNDKPIPFPKFENRGF